MITLKIPSKLIEITSFSTNTVRNLLIKPKTAVAFLIIFKMVDWVDVSGKPKYNFL